MEKHTETKQLVRKKERSQWVDEKIEGENKYLETNENKNTTFHNLWAIAKAFLRGIFIVIQAYLKKQKKISCKQPTLPNSFKGIRTR